MLYIFVRKSLASGTLRQAHISTPTSGTFRREMLRRMLPCHGRDWGCFLGFDSGRRVLVRFVAAMEDVVELGDWIAAFNADGHAMSMVALLDVLIPTFLNGQLPWRRSLEVLLNFESEQLSGVGKPNDAAREQSSGIAKAQMLLNKI